LNKEKEFQQELQQELQAILLPLMEEIKSHGMFMICIKM
jgi:hypothetical protein